jgi:hypothetical protein
MMSESKEVGLEIMLKEIKNKHTRLLKRYARIDEEATKMHLTYYHSYRQSMPAAIAYLQIMDRELKKGEIPEDHDRILNFIASALRLGEDVVKSHIIENGEVKLVYNLREWHADRLAERLMDFAVAKEFPCVNNAGKDMLTADRRVLSYVVHSIMREVEVHYTHYKGDRELRFFTDLGYFTIESSFSASQEKEKSLPYGGKGTPEQMKSSFFKDYLMPNRTVAIAHNGNFNVEYDFEKRGAVYVVKIPLVK